MSESLSLSKGRGGGGGSGVIGLFVSVKLWSTELSFLSVVLVVTSSLTSGQLVSTSSVNVPM